MSFKHVLRTTIRKFGLDVHRFTPGSSEDARLIAMLAAHRVNIVLDVGANTGQFGRLLRAGGYRGRIVSFEPYASAREHLFESARKDPDWDVAPAAAIGSEEGTIELNISRNSVSSSVLSLLSSHTSAAPDAAFVSSETVPLRKLDTMVEPYIRPDSILFMKVDTQGYEDKVLAGAREVLGQAVGVQLEMSLVPLYEGQKLYDELSEQLRSLGFELWATTPAFVDPVSGRHLQIDGTFFRASSNLPRTPSKK